MTFKPPISRIAREIASIEFSVHYSHELSQLYIIFACIFLHGTKHSPSVKWEELSPGNSQQLGRDPSQTGIANSVFWRVIPSSLPYLLGYICTSLLCAPLLPLS